VKYNYNKVTDKPKNKQRQHSSTEACPHCGDADC